MSYSNQSPHSEVSDDEEEVVIEDEIEEDDSVPYNPKNLPLGCVFGTENLFLAPDYGSFPGGTASRFPTGCTSCTASISPIRARFAEISRTRGRKLFSATLR